MLEDLDVDRKSNVSTISSTDMHIDRALGAIPLIPTHLNRVQA